MRHLRITTAELARICGVSQGTVDRALNGRADIKAETKARIIEAARTYGYRADVGKGMPESIKGQIGIIVFDLHNEYFSSLITEIEEILRELGYAAVVMMTHYDKEREIDCIRRMYNMGVSGIILCSVNGGDAFRGYLRLFNIPLVAVGNDTGCLPYVGIDDYSAMRDMTERLLSDGYTDFVYFSPAIRYPDAYAQKERYRGFLAAMGDRPYTVVTDVGEIMPTYSQSTAVVCSTDYYAFRVYLKCPTIKIVGFDNLGTIEAYRLPIDSVGCSVSLVARTAVEGIVCGTPKRCILPHTVVRHG